MIATVTVKSMSATETQKLGEKLAKKLEGYEVIALFGDLGAGKTCFVGGLCRGLGVVDGVSSPTFAIMNEYDGKKKVCHFDMYRVSTEEDLYTTGFFDCVGECVVVVEWSENIEDFLPKDVIKVTIKYGEKENERILSFEGINGKL